MKNFFVLLAGASLAILLSAAGCSKQQSAPPVMPPPEVGVVKITAQTVPVTAELPGRLDAVRTAQVRARATGILLKQVYKEGSDVKEGDVLFQIDPAPLKASLDSAQASLDKAQANLQSTQAKADRYKALAEINAVSKQDEVDASAAALQAKADVEAGKAEVETASLNLGYATVTAPISGRIGPALITEGALVSQTQANQLALIQQLDPIYFDFTQSSTDVLRMRSLFDKGQLQKVAPNEAKVALLLDDGTIYQNPGKLLFADITVDPSTGMITLRAEFPNPDHILLPGMFARVQLEQAVDQNAISVPQRAVTLTSDGGASAMVVTKDNKIEARPLKLGQALGENWMVTDGVQAGEMVVVEGLQKIKPGMTVKPVAFNADADNK